MGEVVIVIPIYRDEITKNEVISLKRLCQVIRGKYPLVLVYPLGLNVSCFQQVTDSIGVNLLKEAFPTSFFQSISGYNSLMMHPQFYKRFDHYEYMLLHQLDCYLFKDDIVHWCGKGYDFIGAPWMNKDESGYDLHGLNGGLSLRKISSHLRVLRSFGRIFNWHEIKRQPFYKNASALKRVYIYIASRSFRNNTFHRFNDFKSNEDAFFSIYAQRRYSWFQTPSLKEASEFAIERSPRFLYQENKYNLPMGCHAWQKYDLEFWKKFIPEL